MARIPTPWAEVLTLGDQRFGILVGGPFDGRCYPLHDGTPTMLDVPGPVGRPAGHPAVRPARTGYYRHAGTVASPDVSAAWPRRRHPVRTAGRTGWGAGRGPVHSWAALILPAPPPWGAVQTRGGDVEGVRMHAHPARRGRRGPGRHGGRADHQGHRARGRRGRRRSTGGAAGASRTRSTDQNEGYYVVVRFSAEPSVATRSSSGCSSWPTRSSGTRS